LYKGNLEQAGKLDNPHSHLPVAKLEGNKLFLNDLAERVYGFDKSSLKINGAGRRSARAAFRVDSN
jgi:hypothetical protein